MDQAVLIRICLAMNRNVLNGDGDAICPWEELSGGRVSRRMCDHIMHHLVTVGTPCLVTVPHTTGSDIRNLARTRWGIMHHMLNDLPVFVDGRNGRQFKSKQYVAFDMPEGFSAWEFLGLPLPKLPKVSFQRQGTELNEPTRVVKLEDLGVLEATHDAIPMQFPELQVSTFGGAKRPRVCTVDQQGYVYEPDATGTLRRTTGKLKLGEPTESEIDQRRLVDTNFGAGANTSS